MGPARRPCEGEPERTACPRHQRRPRDRKPPAKARAPTQIEEPDAGCPVQASSPHLRRSGGTSGPTLKEGLGDCSAACYDACLIRLSRKARQPPWEPPSKMCDCAWAFETCAFECAFAVPEERVPFSVAEKDSVSPLRGSTGRDRTAGPRQHGAQADKA